MKRNEQRITAPRSFNNIQIDPYRGTLKKTSDDPGIKDEREWYQELPKELSWIHPRIFEYYENGFLMEYLDYPTAHMLYMDKVADRYDWFEIFSQVKMIQRIMIAASNIPVTAEESLELAKAMYEEKLKDRVRKVATDDFFKPLMTGDVEINGQKYISLWELAEIVGRYARLEAMTEPMEQVALIHGDIHLGNMLVSNGGKSVKLIDPRGRFGESKRYGDPRYDLAKLMHSVEGGYDLIIEDDFKIEYDWTKRKIKYRFRRDLTRQNAALAFSVVYGKEIVKDWKLLKLIEAGLFLSMIPLHTENRYRQLMMMVRGYELAGKALGALIETS